MVKTPTPKSQPQPEQTKHSGCHVLSSADTHLSNIGCPHLAHLEKNCENKNEV